MIRCMLNEVCGVLTVTPLMGHVHTIVTVDQILQCIVFTPFSPGITTNAMILSLTQL